MKELTPFPTHRTKRGGEMTQTGSRGSDAAIQLVL
jgi:hypothetical protein